MSLLDDTIRSITGQDNSWREKARTRLDQLTMPHWALGKLMDLALDLAGMTRSINPPVERKAVIVLAGDHGVVEEGVSKFPQEVTPQMIGNFINGGAGINALANQVGAEVKVVDMGVAADISAMTSKGLVIDKKVAPGTANMAKGPAMNREQAIASIEAGIDVVKSMEQGIDLFGTGDMGIGNTTPSTAIVSIITGTSVEKVAGRGTGLDDDQLGHKVKVIEMALEVNKPDPNDGIDVLAKVGGFEIGGIAGVILGAAACRKPVLVDGFISTAGALIATSLAPECKDYIIASHRSVEQGHRVMHEHLGLEPLLDLNLRLGEGTGGALAMNVVEAACRVLTDVATFEEAMVSESDK